MQNSDILIRERPQSEEFPCRGKTWKIIAMLQLYVLRDA